MSSSKRTTETTNLTEITDSRVVGGDNSVNLSANDSRVSVMATDHSAVAGGLKLGSEAITTAAKMTADTNATTGGLFSGALEFANATQTQAIDAVKSAYQSGQGGDQVALKYAGFIVVGLAAFAAFKK